VEVQLHAFLTTVLDEGEGSTSYATHFTPGTHRIGWWVCPRASLDACE